VADAVVDASGINFALSSGYRISLDRRWEERHRYLSTQF
jgi:hypothetical protein